MVAITATSGGTIIAPRAEPLLKIPDAVERSCGGNHSLVSFKAAGQLPASPNPRTARKRRNSPAVRANACAMAAPDQKKRFEDRGLDVIASTPEEFLRFVQKESDTLGKLIRDNGIKVE